MSQLHKLQTAVHVAKDKKNEFGGYNYRTAEGILAAIKAVMPDGATIIVTDDLRDVAGQIFVSSTATIRFADNEEHSATGHAMHPLTKKGMDPSQITGSASSYARKYALGGLVALDDGSADPDGAKTGYEPDPPKKEEPKFEPAAARDRIKGKIASARSLNDLKDVWSSEAAVIKEIAAASQPMEMELIAAKDKRKADLQEVG